MDVSPNPFQQLVDLTHRQADALANGEVRRMYELIEQRGRLIATLPSPGPADRPFVEQAIALDRQLSDAVREHMLALRSTAAQIHNRQTNLNGYRINGAQSARLLNFVL